MGKVVFHPGINYDRLLNQFFPCVVYCLSKKTGRNAIIRAARLIFILLRHGKHFWGQLDLVNRTRMHSFTSFCAFWCNDTPFFPFFFFFMGVSAACMSCSVPAFYFLCVRSSVCLVSNVTLYMPTGCRSAHLTSCFLSSPHLVSPWPRGAKVKALDVSFQHIMGCHI